MPKTTTTKIAVDQPSSDDGAQLTEEQMAANAAAQAKPAPRRRVVPTLKAPVAGGQPTVGAAEAAQTPQDAPVAPKAPKTRTKAKKAATGAPAAPAAPPKPGKVQRGVKVHEVPGKTTPPGAPKGETKADVVIGLLKRKEGATLAEMGAAVGWQLHSVRGFMAGTLKKKGVYTDSEKVDGRGRVYRVAPAPEEAV